MRNICFRLFVILTCFKIILVFKTLFANNNLLSFVTYANVCSSLTSVFFSFIYLNLFLINHFNTLCSTEFSLKREYILTCKYIDFNTEQFITYILHIIMYFIRICKHLQLAKFKYRTSLVFLLIILLQKKEINDLHE